MRFFRRTAALAAALILLFTAALADWQPAEGNSPRFSELFRLLDESVGEEGPDTASIRAVMQAIRKKSEDDYDVARAIVDHWNTVTDPAYKMYAYRDQETAYALEKSGLDFSGKHAFVVLGFVLQDGEMQEELVGRCNAAAAAARSYPDAILITTGGATGPNNPEGHTEAGMMKDYLVNECGIDAGRIFTETEAMTTADNAVNSFRIMRGQGIRTYTIVTSNYHQRWAQVLFNAMAAVYEKDAGYQVRMVGNYNYPARPYTTSTTGVRTGLGQLTSLFRNPIRTGE